MVVVRRLALLQHRRSNGDYSQALPPGAATAIHPAPEAPFTPMRVGLSRAAQEKPLYLIVKTPENRNSPNPVNETPCCQGATDGVGDGFLDVGSSSPLRISQNLAEKCHLDIGVEELTGYVVEAVRAPVEA